MDISDHATKGYQQDSVCNDIWIRSAYLDRGNAPIPKVIQFHPRENEEELRIGLILLAEKREKATRKIT